MISLITQDDAPRYVINERTLKAAERLCDRLCEKDITVSLDPDLAIVAGGIGISLEIGPIQPRQEISIDRELELLRSIEALVCQRFDLQNRVADLELRLDQAEHKIGVPL